MVMVVVWWRRCRRRWHVTAKTSNAVSIAEDALSAVLAEYKSPAAARHLLTDTWLAPQVGDAAPLVRAAGDAPEGSGQDLLGHSQHQLGPQQLREAQEHAPRPLLQVHSLHVERYGEALDDQHL